MSDFFNKNAAQTYDERNQRLAPIADNMHFLIRLILKNLPAKSRVLCIGVGTGAEILSLAQEYPTWNFVGVDPSSEMLEICRNNLEKAGILNRCQLINGYVQDVISEKEFDAILSVLVGHFIKKEDRPTFYQAVYQRLRKGGYFINTEISFDLNSKEFSSMLKNWERVQDLMGANPTSLKTLPTTLKNILTVLPPAEVEKLMDTNGLNLPIRFFQAFMINGWYVLKN